MPWLSGWNYRKSHEIVGSTAGAQTDYQVKIIVHYESGTDYNDNTKSPPEGHVYVGGKSRADFQDIRFTKSDGVTELPYWMEEKVDGDYAIFWVKVPSIPASPDITQIYVYYGNPSAESVSNGANTFIFFKDFEDGTIQDLTITTGTWESYSEGAPYGYVLRQTDLTTGNRRGYWDAPETPSNFALEGLGKRNTAGAKGAWCVAFKKGDNLYRFTWEDTNTIEIETIDSWASPTTGATLASAAKTNHTNWFKFSVKYYEGNITFFLEDVTVSVTDTTLLPPFEIGVWCGPDYYKWDNLRVRKYVDPEPSHGAWGGEETAAVTLSVVVSNEFLDKSRGIAGETVTYTATVQDENGNALPSTFKVTLKIDDTIVIQDQPLTSDVYDPTTKKLTLQWTVPSISTFHMIKLVWSEQTINTTTYSAGESTGVEFEIITIPPTLTSEQIYSISLTLIVCMVYISFETVKNIAENMV